MGTQDDVSVQVRAQVDDLVSGLNEAVSSLSEGFKKIDDQVRSFSDGLTKQLGGASKEATAHGREMEEQFKGVGETLEGITQAGRTAFAFVGITAAIELAHKLVEELSEVSERAEQIGSTSTAFGITTKELQGLEVIAARTGASVTLLQRGMLMVQQQMEAAANGSTDAQIKLERVGISLQDIRDPAFTAADALVKMGQSGAANADIMAILGNRSAALLGTIKNLKGGWDDVAEASDAVKALSEDQIKVLEEYKRKTAELDIAWINFKSTLLIGIVPTLTTLLDTIVEINRHMADSPTRTQSWFERMQEGAKGLWDQIKGLASAATPFGAIDAALNQQNKAGAVAGAAAAGDHGRPPPPRSTPPKGTDDLSALQLQSASGSIDISIAEEKYKHERALDEQAAATRRDLALADISLQEQTNQQLFALGEIKAQEFLKQENDILDQKLAANIAYYEELKKLYRNDSDEYLKISNQIVKLVANNAEQKAAIEGQVVRRIQSDWMRMMRPVVDAFATGIEGMINHTLRFGDAVHAVLNSMLTNLVRTTSQAVVKWLATEHAKTAATVAGEETRAAVVEAGHKKGLAASIGAALKEIVVAAYTAAANVYKSVAAIPYVGWILAPIAAAATFAVVAGYGAAVSSAKGGMWEVPGDQMAQIHKKESVLPANIAEPMREFFTGGGQGGGAAGSRRREGFDLQVIPVDKDHGLVKRKDLAALLRTLDSRFAL